MPRAYTVATVALALQVSPKWVDNILSHHSVHGVTGGRQGIARQVTVEGLLHLKLTQLIIHDLGVATAAALALATRVIQTGGRYSSGSGIVVQADLPVIRARILDSLTQAVESAPHPRRGRPRRQSRIARVHPRSAT